jgi:hypothetical protein
MQYSKQVFTAAAHYSHVPVHLGIRILPMRARLREQASRHKTWPTFHRLLHSDLGSTLAGETWYRNVLLAGLNRRDCTYGIIKDFVFAISISTE